MIDLKNIPGVLIVAATVYGEARGEPVEGQIAVAQVINLRSAKRDITFQQVCLAPKQFSCWNEGDPNRAVLLANLERSPADLVWRQCVWVAEGVLTNQLVQL